jgi:hypothetical protein
VHHASRGEVPGEGKPVIRDDDDYDYDEDNNRSPWECGLRPVWYKTAETLE